MEVAQALVAVGERYAGITNPARRGRTSDVLPCVQLETGQTTGLDAHKGLCYTEARNRRGYSSLQHEDVRWNSDGHAAP
jgi:hypothetical protein